MRTKEDIFEEFKKILNQLFEIDPDTVTLETNLFEDLDLDSIDAVDMIVFIQKKTGKKVQPEMFKSVRTVQDVVDVIATLENLE